MDPLDHWFKSVSVGNKHVDKGHSVTKSVPQCLFWSQFFDFWQPNKWFLVRETGNKNKGPIMSMAWANQIVTRDQVKPYGSHFSEPDIVQCVGVEICTMETANWKSSSGPRHGPKPGVMALVSVVMLGIQGCREWHKMYMVTKWRV